MHTLRKLLLFSKVFTGQIAMVTKMHKSWHSRNKTQLMFVLKVGETQHHEGKCLTHQSAKM